jgi:hypothetical protein
MKTMTTEDSGVLASIQTEHILNISLECYFYTNLLDHMENCENTEWWFEVDCLVPGCEMVTDIEIIQ